MGDALQSPLAGWESFYVIIGSSAAALTGLQFVVIAIIKDVRRQASSREIDAFATPTVVHFCAALLLSAIVSAPWRGLAGAATALGVCGFAGVLYGLIVLGRARRQTSYRPVLEDWIWHVVLPLTAYSVLFVSAAVLTRFPERALFGIGATTLLLLFIGIHNAWDTVTFLAIGHDDKSN